MDASALELILLAIAGLILGSFAGAVSWRLPRKTSRTRNQGASSAVVRQVPRQADTAT
jgi:prepilin signal peptidase PulO-like enzyme (type II secretory pathway)